MTELDYFTCIPMVTFNLATLSASFASLNGTGFPEDIKMLKIYNGGNTGVIVSYDGVTDNDIYPANSTFVFDIQANHACNSAYSSGTKYGRKGQVIYGRGTAGIGNLYIIGFH